MMFCKESETKPMKQLDAERTVLKKITSNAAEQGMIPRQDSTTNSTPSTESGVILASCMNPKYLTR